MRFTEARKVGKFIILAVIINLNYELSIKMKTGVSHEEKVKFCTVFFQFPLFVRAGTRELSSLSYGACIRQAEGYCGIVWTRNTTSGDRSFSVSGETPALNPLLLGE